VYWLIGQYPGFVLVSMGSTAVQFTLWTGVLAVIALWLLLRMLMSLLRALLIPGLRLTRNRKVKKKQRNSRLTYRGLLDLAEGRWASACKNLSKSAADSELALINYLGAANAAAELGNEQEVGRLLGLAEKADSRNEMAVALTRVRLLLGGDNYAEALPILQALYARHPKHPYILSLLERTYRNLQQWDQLEKLLADLRANKVMDVEGLYQLEVLIRGAQLRQLANNLDADMAKNKQALSDLWGRMAKNVRTAPVVVANHAELLVQVGESALAEKELRKAIKSTWDKHLLATYSQLEGDTAQRLKIAEGWLKEQPNNAALLLSLARLCKRSELWGKARDYLEAALKLESRPETYAELAEVLGRLGEREKSLQFYRQGLLEVTANGNQTVGLA
jgi:HemY protein